MGVYHFHVDVLSRSSGRSAVGAAAYQSGEKLHATAYVAYQSGEKIIAEGDQIVHDYTRKTGVVHKEILLPQNAPREYADRETLWNAVEKRERRRDARLMREIDAALQVEFTLQENIELLREYIEDNFVSKGMIADLAIHDKKDGNPHAHIKLTLRDVTPEGFGKVNRDWNTTAELVSWRKNWSDINNRLFERKEIDERIDHRSYRARGIDREPTIHLGHEAAALERKGIRTEKGDYNREIQRRNDERAKKETALREIAEKPHEPYEDEKPEHLEELQKIVKEATLEKELQKTRQTPKTARHIEFDTVRPFEPEPKPELENESPFISELEKHLKAEKAMQHIEKMRPPLNAQEIAKHMNALKEDYFVLEVEKILLMETHNADRHDLPPLEYHAELVDEYVKNIDTLHGRAAQLQESRRNVSFLDFKGKKDTDEKIRRAEQEIKKARDFFKNRFHIDPAQAHEELKRLQEEIRIKKDELNEKQILVQAIRKKQEKLELEYHTQKLLAETRPDHHQITQIIEEMNKTPDTIHDKLLYEQIDRRLNTLAQEHFQKVIENLPPYQAHILTTIREQAQKRKLLIEQKKERNRTIERGR
jgi:hypothetical protein